MEKLTIGKLAKACDVNLETIRYYERQGIIDQPPKVGGFRYYGESYITRISFIKRSQQLGFSLKESQELLELKYRPRAKCSDILVKTEDKIMEIENKIRDLKKMKESLKKLANCCQSPTTSLDECSIYECFVKKGKA